MTTFWLSTHLAYACRHSGACCTARSPIPIERDRAAAVQGAIARGRVTAPAEWYQSSPDAPRDVAGILAFQPSGACIFHRPPPTLSRTQPAGGCTIHPWRPRSCEHFPFVCVIDPRGVHATLSHYCPTAASLLFDSRDVAQVVEGPTVFGDDRIPEGLDASDALPPADRAGTRLLSWADVTAFEAALVARLAGDADVPGPPRLEQFEIVRSAVLSGWSWPAAPAETERYWLQLVAPAWTEWAAVVGRYLASKAHASWAMCLGDGPRAVERGVDLARTVLQVEAIRACVARGTLLDPNALLDAIRQSDLLLVHLADPRALVQGAC